MVKFIFDRLVKTRGGKCSICNEVDDKVACFPYKHNFEKIKTTWFGGVSEIVVSKKWQTEEKDFCICRDCSKKLKEAFDGK